MLLLLCVVSISYCDAILSLHVRYATPISINCNVQVKDFVTVFAARCYA